MLFHFIVLKVSIHRRIVACFLATMKLQKARDNRIMFNVFRLSFNVLFFDLISRKFVRKLHWGVLLDERKKHVTNLTEIMKENRKYWRGGHSLSRSGENANKINFRQQIHLPNALSNCFRFFFRVALSICVLGYSWQCRKSVEWI